MSEDKPKYDPFISIQESINRAVAEHRPVRFLTSMTREQLLKGIVDLKGCKLRKPDKNSNEVAVLPGDLAESFDFNEVDTKVTLYNAQGGKLC